MAADAKDLVTLARAKQSNRQITDTTYDTIYQVWLTAASVWIEKYCKRTFYVKAFDELYNGSGAKRLLLREYPVQLVTSVRCRPTTVLKIKNTAPTTNQRATVRVTSTGLTLIRVASGVSTTLTSGLDFAGNPTIDNLVTAINAAAGNYSATRTGDATDYGKWPSADLYHAPAYGDGLSSAGSMDCANNRFAELKLHTQEVSNFEWDPRGWLLRATSYEDADDFEEDRYIWPEGTNNYRVQYTAGYTTIPEAVQEACAILTSQWWSLGNRDPNQLNTVTSTTGTGVVPSDPPASVLQLLQPYRRLIVSNNQG